MDRGVIVGDTDVLVDFLHGEGSHVKARELLRAGRLATTAVTVFAVWRVLETAATREVARCVFHGFRVYALSDAAARRAAEIEMKLRTAPIGERDALIAGICLAIGRPLLTANTRHFRRVPGLEVIPAR